MGNVGSPYVKVSFQTSVSKVVPVVTDVGGGAVGAGHDRQVGGGHLDRHAQRDALEGADVVDRQPLGTACVKQAAGNRHLVHQRGHRCIGHQDVIRIAGIDEHQLRAAVDGGFAHGEQAVAQRQGRNLVVRTPRGRGKLALGNERGAQQGRALGVADAEQGERHGSVHPVGVGAARPSHHQGLVALNGDIHHLVGTGDEKLGIGEACRVGVIYYQHASFAVLGAAAGVRGTGDVGDLAVDNRNALLGGIGVWVRTAEQHPGQRGAAGLLTLIDSTLPV